MLSSTGHGMPHVLLFLSLIMPRSRGGQTAGTGERNTKFKEQVESVE